MTLDEAKQKILDRVLAITDGWECAGTAEGILLTHCSLPGVSVSFEVACSCGESVDTSARILVDGEPIIRNVGEKSPLCQMARKSLREFTEKKKAFLNSRVLEIALSLP